MRVLALLALLTLACMPGQGGDTRIRVTVPPDVARIAAARAIGDAAAPGPILILDDVEVGAGEGITISVLAPAADPNVPPTVLAVTGIAGRSQETPAPPVSKMRIVVPLNARANEVFAGKSSVTLTLRLKNPARGALRVGTATISTSADKP